MTPPRDEGVFAMWTKGFSVTRDSPEFQVVIPAKASELSALEKELSVLDWPKILANLYPLSDRDLGQQRALFLSSDSAIVAVAGFMTDPHGRRAIAVCTVQLGVDWASPELGVRVARAHGLAARLLHAYTHVLGDGNASKLERQLRRGEFVADRRFALADEQSVGEADWCRVLDGVKAVNGVKGLATPRLVQGGINVLLGTRHEAEVALAQGHGLDGFMDPRSWEIAPLTDAISPWMRRKVDYHEEKRTEIGSSALPPNEDSRVQAVEADTVVEERARAQRRQVERSLDDVKNSAHNLVESTYRLARAWGRLWGL